jgi:hypothetical protein
MPLPVELSVCVGLWAMPVHPQLDALPLPTRVYIERESIISGIATDGKPASLLRRADRMSRIAAAGVSVVDALLLITFGRPEAGEQKTGINLIVAVLDRTVNGDQCVVLSALIALAFVA